MDKNFWYAVSILIGMVIGVGIFALPYVFSQAGFFVGVFYLSVLFVVFLTLHLMMSEVVLRTNERHRFIGYVGLYLGNVAKRFIAFTNLFVIFGTLLAYILVSGSFIDVISNSLLSSYQVNQVIFWATMSFILFFGVEILKRSELFFLIFLALAILFMFIFGVGKIDVSSFETINLQNFFLPYGVIMYSFAGISAIPLMRDILFGEEKKLKKAIILGVSIVALVSFLFVFVVVGVSGTSVSEDALSGLKDIFGYKAIFFGALFGLFAIATSYIAYAFYIKNTLVYDFKVKENIAFYVIVVLPILLLVLIPVGFVRLIMFLGAVFGAIEALFLIALYKKAKKTGDRKPEYSLKIPKQAFWIMTSIFVLGIFYEIFYNI